LRKLDSFIATRSRYAEMYNELFADLPEVERPPDDPLARHAWHLYMLRLNLDHLRIDRYEFIEELRRLGIGASVHFIPIPRHPLFARMSLGEQTCKRALELYPRLASLPLYPAMTEEQVYYIGNSVRKLLSSSSRAASRTLLTSAV
jgi:perosamine synthetase